MSNIKVSEMPQADASNLSENDLLMVVQGGENKKMPATTFYQSGSTVNNSTALGGHTADEFVMKTDGRNDADSVGGVPASNMATKDYVDNAVTGGEVFGDPTWCCPKLWFSSSQLPNNDSVNWAFCNGQALLKSDYPELYAIIGARFTRDENGYTDDTLDYFKLPNLNGRFILGANTGSNPIVTHNLPTELYEGNPNILFNNAGQFVMPTGVGVEGGDPTTEQHVVAQIAAHDHWYSLYRQNTSEQKWIDRTGNVSSEDSGIPRLQAPAGTNTTAVAGMNGLGEEHERIHYPANKQTYEHHNWGMLSMPPFVTFAYIMRIKPPQVG